MEQLKEDILIENKNNDIKHIIVYNDDVNTFDHVIESLVDICNMDIIAANQCSLIIHYKGKCDVKSGDYEELKPKCLELLNRQISAKIE
ncbi:ATP-dependent Clp protease adaptor ClpS [Candidatus Dojkabacteria bacterium]|jgi:ATP-dependent Clp protease adaptor protein ClpS|nr:ATP-dependent Clp protease adaptor ClpS [Candidatus Dojkabacteria bacterium]